VQRIFSAFPTGPPGLALLLLRISVAVQLLFHAPPLLGGLSWWLAAGLAVGLLVVLGIFTPVVSACCAVLQLAWLLQPESGSMTVPSVAIIDALALTMLGPGGYSADAWLFGRRLLTVRPPPRRPVDSNDRSP
jgi:hypothetical protein